MSEVVVADALVRQWVLGAIDFAPVDIFEIRRRSDAAARLSCGENVHVPPAVVSQLIRQLAEDGEIAAAPFASVHGTIPGFRRIAEGI